MKDFIQGVKDGLKFVSQLLALMLLLSVATFIATETALSFGLIWCGISIIVMILISFGVYNVIEARKTNKQVRND